MSEYWKSVPRKFCDFCKCWITDNKPSVDFHERGKKHQENVERRLKEVRKKSYEDSQAKDKIDKQMEDMEKAALAAFKKDLAANPELAKQYGVSLEPKPAESSSSAKFDKKKVDEKETKKDEDKEKEWYEAKSPEGYTYYWSTVTGESKWEAPEEFVSLAEQESQKNEEGEPESVGQQAVESGEEKTEAVSNPESQTQDPSFSRSAFGAWEVVKEESRPVIYDDASEAPLPDSIPLPDDIPQPKPKSDGPKFKEKTVKSLGPPPSGDSGMPAFKKRKIASGARNVRKRGDDD